MNTADQVLRKRCQALERRTAWLEDVVGALLRDLEFTESIGAAFAWDVGSKVLSGDHPAFPPEQASVVHNKDYLYLSGMWDRAVKALEGEQDAARGIRRAHDGSIISILPTQANDPNLSAP